MTTPQPATASTRPAQPPPGQPPVDRQTAAKIAAILAAGLTAAATVAALAALLHVGRKAAKAALTLVLIPQRGPVTAIAGTPARAPVAAPTVVSGPAGQANRRRALLYRAWYLGNAAHRIDRKLRAGDTLRHALHVERPYWRAHRTMQRRRAAAADDVDQTVLRVGGLLGWYAVDDERTSLECRAADGHNFRADRRPVIGWPGAVHPACRCYCGPPHPGAGSVDQAVAYLRGL